jgi:hypothetical protein
MKDIKLAIALSFVFALSGTSAFASTVHHRPGVRTHDLHRGFAPVRSGHPNIGNPEGSGTVSAGGYLWNGRSASEFGGD